MRHPLVIIIALVTVVLSTTTSVIAAAERSSAPVVPDDAYRPAAPAVRRLPNMFERARARREARRQKMVHQTQQYFAVENAAQARRAERLLQRKQLRYTTTDWRTTTTNVPTKQESQATLEDLVELTKRQRREQIAIRKAEIAKHRTQYSALKAQLLKAINKERIAAGVQPLNTNVLLEKAAQAHAEDMWVKVYFDHYSYEGWSFVDRIHRTGFPQIDLHACNCKPVVGENIARGQRGIRWVINDWLDSPAHRENMLSDKFTDVGIGIAEDYWVTNFGGTAPLK